MTKQIKHSPVFGDLMTPALISMVESLLEERVSPMLQHPQLLVTLPSDRPWTVPHSGWHTDLHPIRNHRRPGVQVFVCLDRVAPGGGGTLAVAGSHRLLKGVPRLGSKAIKQRLVREEYFRELLSKNAPNRERFPREAHWVGGTEVQVVELTGEAGDVHLMDMRILHAPAPNASSQPRMVVAHRYVRAEVHAEIERMMEEVMSRVRSASGSM